MWACWLLCLKEEESDVQLKHTSEEEGGARPAALNGKRFLFWETPLPSSQPQDFHWASEKKSFGLCVSVRVGGLEPAVLFARQMHTRRRLLYFCHSPSFSSDTVVTALLYLLRR